MEALAAAIFLSTALFLVDKNKKWPAFWKVSAAAVVAVILLYVGVVAYDYYGAKQAEAAAHPKYTIESPDKR